MKVSYKKVAVALSFVLIMIIYQCLIKIMIQNTAIFCTYAIIGFFSISLVGFLIYKFINKDHGNDKTKNIRLQTMLFDCFLKNKKIKINHINEIVNFLDVEIDERKYDCGGTLLHLAVKYNSVEVANLLINKNAKIDIKDNYGKIPLHLAAANGNINMVQCLIEKDANNEVRDNNGSTPLHLAAANGHENVVQCLIEKGANNEVRDNNGSTPLHLAAANGHTNVVQCLIEKGANNEVRDNNGSTPLHLAAASGHANVVQCLIEKGANNEVRDNNHKTAIDLVNEKLEYINSKKSDADLKSKEKVEEINYRLIILNINQLINRQTEASRNKM